MKFKVSFFGLLVAGVVSSASVAMAQVEVFKLLDGHNVTCSANKNESTPTDLGQKVLMISLTQDSSTQTDVNPTIKVEMVVCDSGRWVADKSPLNESYSINGIDVEVTYSDFQLYLVDENYNVLLHTTLTAFGEGKTESEALSFARTKETEQRLQLIITAQKHVKGSNGYEFSERLSFGAYRLRVK